MAAEPQTIAALAYALKNREATSIAVTEACLTAIAEKNPSLNAFITVFAEEARTQARAADAEIAAGRHRGALHGVPISLKDLIDVAGFPTTAASRVREGHVAATDALATARLRAAGAVLVGKTNLHEFAFGTTNEESAFGPARHPLDPSLSPGGSSGGSAVSVAAEMAYASIGTDTGGSIRIPSALCGLVGLKPTLGEIPTTGVVPLSTTMDHLGPLCRSAEDAQLIYDVLRGTEAVERGTPPAPERLCVGVLRDYFTSPLDPEVASQFDYACARLRDAGVQLRDVRIPHAGDIAPVYLHIVLAEAAAYHAKTLESRADHYTPGVRLRLEMGRCILAEDYVRALRGRALLTHEVDEALKECDALLLPSVPLPAFKIGTTSVRLAGSEESIRNITLRLTQLFDITGHPAISIPCGATAQGLPVGAQLVGRSGLTTSLLDLARGLEPPLRGEAY